MLVSVVVSLADQLSLGQFNIEVQAEEQTFCDSSRPAVEVMRMTRGNCRWLITAYLFLSLELPGRLGNVCVKDHDPTVVLSLSVPTVHQKRFRMIFPQCATCQEKVLFESSGMFTIAFHFEFGEGFYKTSCSVAMAIMIFNWNNEK